MESTMENTTNAGTTAVPPALTGTQRIQAFVEAIAIILAFMGVRELVELLGVQNFRSAFGMFGAIILATWLLRRRGQNWADMGFKRPEKLWLTGILTVVSVVVGYGAAVAATIFIAPLFDLSSSSHEGLFFEPGDLVGYLSFLLVMGWGSASFGEELTTRGFMLSRFSEAFGGRALGMALAVFAQAAVFGMGHYSLGGTGMLTAAAIALVFGALFYLGKRNLWHLILAHGFIDTFSLTMLYMGVTSGH
jgi:CAAX protease family protein